MPWWAEAIYARIQRGFFPALVSGRVRNRDRFYQSYVSTYVERDVHDLARVTDEERFLKFVRAAAARTEQLLNLSELAQSRSRRREGLREGCCVGIPAWPGCGRLPDRKRAPVDGEGSRNPRRGSLIRTVKYPVGAIVHSLSATGP